MKDDPGRSFWQSPDAAAFHKYYYSQPLPEGGRDNDRLEDFFSALESKWPPLVERVQRRENVNDALDDIFSSLPCSERACPHCATLKATLLQLDATGRLPAEARGRADILNHVDFAIDPHHSIHSMPTFLRAMGEVLNSVGLGILHNVTDVPFITSDNPVVYFDPRTSEEELLPYTLDRAGGPVVLCFPSPRLMLYGHSSMREGFACEGLRHSDIDEEGAGSECPCHTSVVRRRE